MTSQHLIYAAAEVCTPENLVAVLRKAGAVGGVTITDEALAAALVEAHPFPGDMFQTQVTAKATEQIETLLALTQLADTKLADFVRSKTLRGGNVTINFGLPG